MSSSLLTLSLHPAGRFSAKSRVAHATELNGTDRHDRSLWQPVIEHLEQLGHTAYGPTVAGHGKDVPKNVTHAESTQSIVDFIVGNPIGLADKLIEAGRD